MPCVMNAPSRRSPIARFCTGPVPLDDTPNAATAWKNSSNRPPCVKYVRTPPPNVWNDSSEIGRS